jgi:lipoprotein-releasing system permease protein
MYKLLLCWRYLRTRYIALVTIVSVMLGVAAIIATNAVMGGAQHELQERLHGVLSDIVVTSHRHDGVPNADVWMEHIREVAGQYIEGMSPTVVLPAMLSYSVEGQYNAKQIMLVGVDEKTCASVSDIGNFLQHPANRKNFDFQLKESGYDEIDHQAIDPGRAAPRPQMATAGWLHRRRKAALQERLLAPEPAKSGDPFSGFNANTIRTFDPARQTHTGAVLGIDICSFRTLEGTELFHVVPGDDVEISYLSAGQPPTVLSAKFTVADFYESRYVEYDSSFVFVPIRTLQELRGMIDRTTGIANFTAIQIKAKPGVDLNMVRDVLRRNLPMFVFEVDTWRDRQGPLLAAVQFEMGVLNVLLSLIIAVAGFGILAIFSMIVVEKTRDIGILKSLGASRRGVMAIFLGYGFSLGIVGAGAGLVLGLLIVHYIVEITEFAGYVLGNDVFDPSVYGFHEIPAIVEWFSVSIVLLGAVAIAVLASILPARRAARLHPVEALRYE